MTAPKPPAPHPDTKDFTERWWPEPAERVHTNGDTPVAPGAAPAYAQAAFAAEVRITSQAPQGRRNHTLNISGFNLAQLVGAGHLPRTETWDALFDAALSTGLEEKEVHATLTSAFRAGEAKPRDVPKAHEPYDFPDATIYDPPPSVDGSDAEQGSIGKEFPVLDWQELWDDETTEEWIVEPLLAARRLVALFSPPKIGKSLLMLEIAVAISRGEPMFGYPTTAHRVLYVDFENDPRGDIRTRLQAMGRKPSELGDLRYLSFPRLPYLDTVMGGLVLLQVLDHHGCDVVVIDTVSRAVGGEENDNDTWLSFYRHTGLALKARGISTIRLDHTGKDEAKGMRGGSAKYGDVDAVWSLSLVKGSTDMLRLECTANRLVINEKELMLQRELDPLRHVVSLKRTGNVWADQEQVVIDQLDELGVPWDTGRPNCIKALQEAGLPVNGDRMTTAVRKRKERGPARGLHAEEIDFGDQS